MRNLLFDCLKQAFNLSKHKWALPSLNGLFKKLYKDKTKFSPSQIEEISTMINLMNSNLGNSLSLDTSRHYRDDNIKVNPLMAGHKVSDARDEKITVSGFDSWNAKQSGFTYGKLSINK
jgi:hypothetical protein